MCSAITLKRSERWAITDRGYSRNSEGGPLRKSNFLRREFHPLLLRAGLPKVTFHSIRHVANSILAATGEPISVPQARGGWSSSRMPLDVYGTYSKASSARLINWAISSRLFNGADPTLRVGLPNVQAERLSLSSHVHCAET